MNKRIYDANPLPLAVRRVLGAAAAVASVALVATACWTAGPGNWVPPMVREAAAGRVPVYHLPTVVVTAKRVPAAALWRGGNEQAALLCDDGSVPVARMVDATAAGVNLQP